MRASFHFLVIGLSSHVLCVDGELGRDEMADREDEMNLLLRVVVFGIRAEIGASEISYQANERTQYPRAQTTISRGGRHHGNRIQPSRPVRHSLQNKRSDFQKVPVGTDLPARLMNPTHCDAQGMKL